VQTAAASARAIADSEPDTDRVTKPRGAETSHRRRMVFGFDATASHEPAWATAKKVTDALVKTLPGALDVALVVHGGRRLHTFTPYTSDARTLRDHAASVECHPFPRGFSRSFPRASHGRVVRSVAGCDALA
jgi:hypothetical protein